MVRYLDKTKAIAMRKKGMSYSTIKEKLGVSKSTLSGWLREMPLSRERINELRGNSQQRIEKYRNTMRQKSEARTKQVYEKIGKMIGSFSKREMLIAGIFLYWGEGGKTMPYTISLTNTDPKMIRFYMHWLSQLDVPKDRIKVRLHLYSDMNVQEMMKYWAQLTKLPLTQFNKPQIKKSSSKKILYRGHGKGTCTIVVHNRDVAGYVLQGLAYIQNMYK